MTATVVMTSAALFKKKQCISLPLGDTLPYVANRETHEIFLIWSIKYERKLTT